MYARSRQRENVCAIETERECMRDRESERERETSVTPIVPTTWSCCPRHAHSTTQPTTPIGPHDTPPRHPQIVEVCRGEQVQPDLPSWGTSWGTSWVRGQHVVEGCRGEMTTYTVVGNVVETTGVVEGCRGQHVVEACRGDHRMSWGTS